MSRSSHSFSRQAPERTPAPRSELRRHKRRNLVYYVGVRELLTGRALGRVGDVSDTGLLLLDNHDLHVGQTVDLALELEGVRGMRDETFEARAHVRWTRRHVEGVQAVGLEFEGIDHGHLAVLDLLVWMIGFKDK